MCRQLLAGGVPGLHMYSLNLEATVFGILERVGFMEVAKVPKPLPWRHIPVGTRRQVGGQMRSRVRMAAVLEAHPGWHTAPGGGGADEGQGEGGICLEDGEQQGCGEGSPFVLILPPLMCRLRA